MQERTLPFAFGYMKHEHSTLSQEANVVCVSSEVFSFNVESLAAREMAKLINCPLY